MPHITKKELLLPTFGFLGPIPFFWRRIPRHLFHLRTNQINPLGLEQVQSVFKLVRRHPFALKLKKRRTQLGNSPPCQLLFRAQYLVKQVIFAWWLQSLSGFAKAMKRNKISFYFSSLLYFIRCVVSEIATALTAFTTDFANSRPQLTSCKSVSMLAFVKTYWERPDLRWRNRLPMSSTSQHTESSAESRNSQRVSHWSEYLLSLVSHWHSPQSKQSEFRARVEHEIARTALASDVKFFSKPARRWADATILTKSYSTNLNHIYSRKPLFFPWSWPTP